MMMLGRETFFPVGATDDDDEGTDDRSLFMENVVTEAGASWSSASYGEGTAFDSDGPTSAALAWTAPKESTSSIARPLPSPGGARDEASFQSGRSRRVPLWQKRSLPSLSVHSTTSSDTVEHHEAFKGGSVCCNGRSVMGTSQRHGASATLSTPRSVQWGQQDRVRERREAALHGGLPTPCTAPPMPRRTEDSQSSTMSPASSRSSSASPPRPHTACCATPRTPASAPTLFPGANELYKTEMCRSWMETGTCRYGAKCQFAHGSDELRQLPRHPKYKTKICKNFEQFGSCPYGGRCRFIHERPRRESFEGLEPDLLAVIVAGGGATPRKLPIFEQLHQGLEIEGHPNDKGQLRMSHGMDISATDASQKTGAREKRSPSLYSLSLPAGNSPPDTYRSLSKSESLGALETSWNSPDHAQSCLPSLELAVPRFSPVTPMDATLSAASPWVGTDRRPAQCRRRQALFHDSAPEP